MTESNKKSLAQFGKAVLLGIIIFTMVVTAAGVWNCTSAGTLDSFYGWVAGINLIAEALGAYFLCRKLYPGSTNENESK